MTLEFISPEGQRPGAILGLLTESYTDLLSSDPETWGGEVQGWEELDRAVFTEPETVGASVFLSRYGGRLVGFASYDPRQRPEPGVIGHNCIAPQCRGNGFGTEQIREVIGIFGELQIGRAIVTTLDHPFFAPARRMYIGCGFQETGRTPWDRDPRFRMVTYEKKVR